MLFSTLSKNKKKYPFTYWLNGRCFLQIVERDSWNLYPLYPLFPCSDFVSQMWGWFGGGGCNVFLTFYAISNRGTVGIYIHYILYSLVLILYLKCGGGLGGGGVMFFSHFMLFPTFLEKKSGNTNQLFLI